MMPLYKTALESDAKAACNRGKNQSSRGQRQCNGGAWCQQLYMETSVAVPDRLSQDSNDSAQADNYMHK